MKHLWITSLLALAACAASGPDPSYQLLTADAEPLRTAFNSANGKARAILLAAPS